MTTLHKNIVLVLNRNWQAINIRTPQDAFCQMATNVATALDIEGEDSIRESRRAPTDAPVRILTGGREKEGTLFSLSEGGCFLQTPRASMDGAQLEVAFELEGHSFRLPGVVAFSNVPGNLQRPNLPLGMGLRFTEISSDDTKRIREFVAARYAELNV